MRLLPMAAALAALSCARTPQKAEVHSAPIAFIAPPAAVHRCAVAAADSMGWEVMERDDQAGTILARMSDGTEVTITVIRRRDGLTQTTLTPKTPDVVRQIHRFSEYLRQAYTKLR
ncbi:hypothetical protein ACFL6X_07035 [Candidatus Latescibacterota bacterium]